MHEPLLTSRVESLRKHLRVVIANLEYTAWESEQPAQPQCCVELMHGSELWGGLEITLIKRIQEQLKELTKIEVELAAAQATNQAAVTAAWVRYSTVQRESEALLREGLEIIGSLAIRTKGLDKRTLYIADELIRECLKRSLNDHRYYLLVNSFEETLCRARARIIRLRFPEWTVWDLPLVGHELGRVAIADILADEKVQGRDQLTRFLKNQRDSLVVIYPGLSATHQSGAALAAEVERRAEVRVSVLLADAFATYMLGPAYACSAIMLRLNPSVTSVPEELPSESERAFIILETLQWMNERGGMPKPYTDIIDRLRDAWRSTVSHSNPAGLLSDALQAYLKQLADSFAGELGDLTMSTAMYPPRTARNEGWAQAEKWKSGWIEQLGKDPTKLDVPGNDAGKLRDVLNACWLARLERAGGPASHADGPARARELEAIAKVAQDLCMAIIQFEKPRGAQHLRSTQPLSQNT